MSTWKTGNIYEGLCKNITRKTFWVQISHFIVRNAFLKYIVDHEYDGYQEMLNEIREEV